MRKKRESDYNDLLEEHTLATSTDPSIDPAKIDPMLAAKLENNRKNWRKLDDVRRTLFCFFTLLIP